jgi:eukaryotic-like serine/threonine-protein kinase
LSDPRDDNWLIALADEVCQGKRVDWEQVEAGSANPQTEAALRGLRRLVAVVDAHRAELEQSAPDEAAAPQHKLWRHLILLEVVGSGAFGTVHRAWDTRLEREVALKLLRVTDGRDPLSEAQHLARIRHPNVMNVYGADQIDDQVGIWMEFIEGQTLAALVRDRGPMSAREVAGIGIDVCRALSALHSAGLLHRDIKAHNVMREVGGRIVLMDFSGVGDVTPEAGAALSGTPLYMAPELFDGAQPSAATDTYSLGVLLFYLFSGRLPVEGNTLSDVRRIYKSGKRLRLRDLRPELPDPVVQLVERATHIDPSARFLAAADMESALAGLLGSHATPAPSAAVNGRRRRALGWVAAATVVAGAAIGATLLLRPRHEPVPPVVQFTIGPPYDTSSWPRVSPDGRLVVFGTLFEGRSVFWVRALDAVQGRPLTSTIARETPFWSPDGRQLAYVANGKLQVVDVETGRMETIAEVGRVRGGDWNAQGVLLVATETGIDRFAPDGSGHSHVTVLDSERGEYRHSWPAFLPDGRRFLYIVRSKVDGVGGLYVGSLDSPVRRRVMPGYSRVAYSPSGHLLFVRNGTLMAQPFDERSAQVSGEPVAIAADVKYHAGDDAAFDVSRNGVLVYRVREQLASTRLVVMDRRGREIESLGPPAFYSHPRFSPDGNRVVVEKTLEESSNSDVWLFDLRRRSASQLTRNTAPDINPVWAPDGQHVAFSSKRGAFYDVYRKQVDAVPEEQRLYTSEENKRVDDWSRDGRLVAFSVPRQGLWILNAKTMQRSLVRRTTGSDNGMQAEFSPNTKFIAYAADDSGRPEVYVEPVPATGARWQLSSEGGAEPHWRADGSELLFVSADGWLMSTPVGPGPGWNPGAPQRLFRVALQSFFGGSNFTLSPDGERIVVNSLIADPAFPAINVIVNSPVLRK